MVATINTGAMTLIDLANPTKFLWFTARVLPWLVAATAILLSIGLYRSAVAPNDYQQGATVKIMFIHVPNAWLSVDWWNTLHQPASVLRMGGATLDRAFLIPLLVMAVAFSLLFVTLHLAAMRNEILRRRVRALQMMQASRR
jgi:heme exporter protein C